jgi:hypothetical protein
MPGEDYVKKIISDSTKPFSRKVSTPTSKKEQDGPKFGESRILYSA